MKSIKKVLILCSLLLSFHAYALDDSKKLDLAESLIESYDCPEAVRVLSDLLIDTSVNDKAVTLTLNCLFKMKKFDKAITIARNFLVTHPFHLESRVGIIKSLLSLNQKDTALEEAEILFKMHGQNANAVTLYTGLLADKDLIQAIKTLDEYHAKNKDTGVTRLLLAELYIKERQFTSALDELKRAQSIGPLSEKIYVRLSEAYLGLSQFDKALENIKFATKLAPEVPESYIEWSRIYFSMGKMDAAKDILSSALDQVSNRGRSKILVQLARFQLQQGLYQLARETLSSAKKISPHQNIIPYLTIRSYLLENDFASASKNLEIYIKEHPSHNWAILARARILKTTSSEDVVAAWVSDFLSTSENPNELKDFISKDQEESTVRLPASSPNFERVKVGDTLYGISRRVFGRTRYWKSIYEWNRNVLSDPNILREGTWLKICRDEKCLN
ncbi:MAG: tetratricopeptide repeat protein [Oligoflexia bacterium]|nr:tetratricopeptide repeat protein [Oligoflexia bacterium]